MLVLILGKNPFHKQDCSHHFECWTIYRILEYIIWFLWMVSRVKTYRKMDKITNILSPFPSPELHAVLPAMFVNKKYVQYNQARIPLQNVLKWLHGFYPRTSELLGELPLQTTATLKKKRLWDLSTNWLDKGTNTCPTI